MQKSYLLISLIILSITNLVMAQNNENSKLWKQVETEINSGKPLSAKKLVDDIYTIARKAEDRDQILKCLLYQNRLRTEIEEDHLQQLIIRMEKEYTAEEDLVIKATLASLIGGYYNNFLNNNYHRIYNRTNLSEESQDLQNFTVDQLLAKSRDYYLSSIENSDIRSYKINELEEIINIENEKVATDDDVYSFLVMEAIRYFQNSRNQITEPVYKFALNDDLLMGSTEEFLNYDLSTKDTLSSKYHAALLFQNALRLYQSESVPTFLKLELERLRYMKNHGAIANKDQKFVSALKNLISDFDGNEYIDIIKLELLTNYYNKAQLYNPVNDDEIDPAKDLIPELLTLSNSLKDSNFEFVKKAALLVEEAVYSRSLSFTTEMVVPLGSPSLLYLKYRNTPKVYFKLYQLSEVDRREMEGIIQQKKYARLDKFEVIDEWSKELPSSEDLINHSIEIVNPERQAGEYILVALDEETYKEAQIVHQTNYHVSNLAYYFQSMNNSHYVVVMDRMTGYPIEGVHVELLEKTYNHRANNEDISSRGKYVTNSEGLVEVKGSVSKRNNFALKIWKDKDFLNINAHHYLSNKVHEGTSKNVVIFTDRSIYRPGQTVYFKGIVLEYDNKRIPSLLDKKTVALSAWDANGQKFFDQTIEVDEFGAFHSTLVLPADGLKGNYHIRVNDLQSNKFIKVEEYKRPTFYGEFEKSTKEYVVGDDIKLPFYALNYSGIKLNHAKYRYQVKRVHYRPWYYSCYYRSMPNSQTTLLTQGNDMLDESGKGVIKFNALPDNSLENQEGQSYNYIISIDIIDVTGETQTISKSFLIGDKPYQWNLSHDQITKLGEEVPFGLQFTNFQGEKVEKSGEIVISKIDNSNESKNAKLWSFSEFNELSKEEYYSLFPHDMFSKDELPTEQKINKIISRIDFKNLKSDSLKLDALEEGYYLVELFVSGEKTVHKSYFSVVENKLLAIPTLVVSTDQKKYKPGEKANLHCLTNFNDAKIFYQLFRRNDIVECKWLDANTNKEILIDEDDLGNLTATSFYIKNNRFYTNSTMINVPWDHKNLQVEFETIRNKVEPGSTENWKIKLVGLTDDSAQLTLGMYDASLDAIQANAWYFSPYPIYSMPWSQDYSSFGVLTSRYFGKYPNYKAPYSGSYLFPYFNHQYVHSYNQWGITSRSSRMASGKMQKSAMRGEVMEMSAAPAPQGAQLDQVTISEDARDIDRGNNKSIENNDENEVGKKDENKDQPIRENLKETVFFYPDIMTDKDGNASFEFIINEAITEWKLMAFAHNKSLQYGYNEVLVKTQKDLLIVPNMPRFLRAGDQVDFTAKVSNLSDSNLTATSTIQVLNAISEEDITESLLQGDLNISTELAAGQSKSVSWNLVIPNDLVIPVVVKIFSNSGKHTDGEMNLLPVLANRKLITASKAIMVKGGEEKNIIFEHFKDHRNDTDLEHYNYQIEFTTNPVWFAIKSIPYVSGTNSESISNLVDQLYVNTLSKSIIDKYPKIKSVFGQWKLDPIALKSELSKNEDLKSVTLINTPWVRDAMSEEEQRNNIALLFDINKLANQQKGIIRKLKNRQNSNGGFSWYPGGRDNWYLTQYALLNISRLRDLKLIFDDTVNEIYKKSQNYCASKVNEYYYELKNHKAIMENNHLTGMIIQFAYINSMSAQQMFDGVDKEAANYFVSQMEKYWTEFTPFLQAAIALSAHRTGNFDLTEKIKISLKERVINNPELGSYWKVGNSYRWYGHRIEQQGMMIELFETLGQHEDLVANLKMWLLTQKQTNRWPTSSSTVAAIHGLLYNSMDWIESNNKIYVWLGDVPLKVNNLEAGTGYFSKKYDTHLISKSFGEIRVKNPAEHIIWGAAYWQYWQDLDQIEVATENPFKISKEVFLEKMTDRGPVLEATKNGKELKQGDRLKVRIELTTDRDLNYVHMQDMRAAGLEPENIISQYKYQDGLSYYESTSDVATDFFFERIRRGTYIFEYNLRVTHKGNYSNGVTTAQCLYAPEFAGHSNGLGLQFN